MVSSKLDRVLVFLILVIAIHCESVHAAPQGRNSMDKLRTTPSATARRVGSAVNWQTSLPQAKQISAATGKPIFWYVPTLSDSFMDRKIEIDRYLRAGMFSWPDIVDSLNTKFVPLLAIPEPQPARALKLAPFQFVEPGFLILGANGRMLDRVDRITTQHPAWFRQLLGRYDDRLLKKPADDLSDAWRLLADRKFAECLKSIQTVAVGDTRAAEKLLLAGMAHFRIGQTARAVDAWRQAALIQPEHPLAWKAAAEAEGIGPFVRGFEIHTSLPTAALMAGRQSVGSAAPTGVYSEADVWRRGVQYLLGMQTESGGFVDCDYDFGGTDSLPNVHVAVTSIVGMSLLKAKARENPPVGVSSDLIDAAVARAKTFVLDDANWNFDDSDELFWAHAYRVRFLIACLSDIPADRQQLSQAVAGLQAMQLRNGSWYHEYANPFVTGLALLTLKEAERAGVSVDREIVSRGVRSLAQNRGRGGFLYYDRSLTDPRSQGADLSAPSAGRLSLCELGLESWGAATTNQLSDSIRQSFAKQSHLIASLKYDDHTSRHGYGGFFFWFDVHGRSHAIARLPAGQDKRHFQNLQRQLIMSLPEIDGCFVDSHELGRCYGTAMALLSLETISEGLTASGR